MEVGKDVIIVSNVMEYLKLRDLGHKLLWCGNGRYCFTKEATRFSDNDKEKFRQIISEIDKVIGLNEITICWGIGSRTPVIFESSPALKLEVNGYLHSGDVLVVYNEGKDQYDIAYFKDKKEVLERDYGVYADQLISVIDSKIEKDCSDEEYHKKSMDELFKFLFDE